MLGSEDNFMVNFASQTKFDVFTMNEYYGFYIKSTVGLEVRVTLWTYW